MAKLRHIAIATRDPEKTAQFYKDVFEFQEVGRSNGHLAHGIYLSDGTINMAILDFSGSDFDQLGKGMDFTGVHHFGVVVENRKELSKKLEAMGAPCILDEPQSPTSFFEVKHRGPDGVVFDISEKPWIGSAGLNGD
jgi:methylmalonyl-CoA/ethylmalonyl-CoA epimerase